MIAVNIIVSVLFIAIVVFLIYKLKSTIDYCRFLQYDHATKIKDLESKHKIQFNDIFFKLRDKHKENEFLKQQVLSTKCILCNAPSKGNNFCPLCYSKYKERSLDVRIEKCSKTTILDYYGNKTFACDDGRMVRSRAEVIISNFLFNNKIRYIYEKPIYHYVNNEIKTFHPDFYLPDFDLYIEYNELITDSYNKSKNYAMQIYKQKGLNVLIMSSKELQNIQAFLSPRLGIT